MVLEVLIPGITDYQKINTALTEEQLASAISLSYCLILKPNIKKEELGAQLDILKKYTLPAEVEISRAVEQTEQAEQADADMHPSAYEN